MSGRTKNIDGGWAWVILICGFGVSFLDGFLAYSMGIITEAMLEVFDGDLTLTSAVGSAIVASECFAGPPAAVLTKRFGCRSCTIIGGIMAAAGLVGASVSRDLYTLLIFFIITGIGFGISLVSCSVMVGRYFHRLRPLATGIQVTGAGFGLFVGPPSLRYFIDQYGLHGAFLIIAGMASHNCVLGCLLRPLPNNEDIPNNEEIPNVHIKRSHYFKSTFVSYFETLKKCGICPSRIWKNTGFMMYLFSLFLWIVAESACLLHLPNYCVQQGTSKTGAALLLSGMGIGNIVSKLLAGFAANDEGISILSLQAGQLGVASIFTALFPLYSRTYGGQMAFSVAIGMYSNGLNCLCTPIIVKLIGLEYLPIGFGLYYFSYGLGYFTGPPIAGAIVDHGSTYKESFLFAGFMFLMASLSTMLIPLVHSKTNDNLCPGIHSVQDITVPCGGNTGIRKDEMDDHSVNQSDIKTIDEIELEPLK